MTQQALLINTEHIIDLHYGLFKQHSDSLAHAQQAAIQTLITALPSAPCRLLMVNIQAVSLLQQLITQGYDCHVICSDKQRLQFIQDSNTVDITIHTQTLAEGIDSKKFDVILLHESTQSTDPVTLFKQSSDLLVLEGHLLILDEFYVSSIDSQLEPTHLIDDLFLLADRSGFECILQKDLSDLVLPNQQLNQTAKDKYSDKRYCYQLLQFQKVKQPRWRIQHLASPHLERLLYLFEHSFNHTMSTALWQWKYAHNNAHELCIWEEDQLIAHYGGMPRDILFFGQPETAVQIGDVMVNSSKRGILTRKGPFFLMASAFAGVYVGFGKPFLVGFGFPNERHMKIAERLGIYTEVGDMVEISWPCLNTKPQLFSQLVIVQPQDLAQYANQIDQCWSSMSQQLNQHIIGLRDWRYILNRYLHHPEQQYHYLLVKQRLTGHIIGLAIIHMTEQRCELLDVISSPKYIPLLVQHARRFATLHQYDKLACQVTSNISAYFETIDGQIDPLDIRIPSSIWNTGPATEQLKNNWWLMAGDMDSR